MFFLCGRIFLPYGMERFGISKMKKNNTLALTEAGVMISLSAVLSLLKLIELPYGGSVTFASMLPIIIYSYRHGIKYGLGAGLAASAIQLLLGLKYFSYFTTWYSIVSLAVFDYIIAFSAFGIGSAFKKRLPQSHAIPLAALIASVIRYICHFITGATIWAGLSIPTEAAIIYSLGYNATYMIPETIVLCTVAAYLTSAIDFSQKTPARRTYESSKVDYAPLMKILASLIMVFAIIFDTEKVFGLLQDADSGEFIITNLALVNWSAIVIVTAVSVIAATLLLLGARGVFTKKRDSRN